MRCSFAIPGDTGTVFNGPNIVSLLRSIMRWKRKIEVHIICVFEETVWYQRNCRTVIEYVYLPLVMKMLVVAAVVYVRWARIHDPVVCSQPPCCTAKVWFLCYRLPFSLLEQIGRRTFHASFSLCMAAGSAYTSLPKTVGAVLKRRHTYLHYFIIVFIYT